MRARTQLAFRLANTPADLAGLHEPGPLDRSAMLSIPWDISTLGRKAALVDALELRHAMNCGDSVQGRAEIRQIEQDIKDHLAEGQRGLAYLSAFYNQAAPQVARLASVLNSWDGTITRPLTARDQQTLGTFASGLAYVTKNGAEHTGLTREAMNALMSAPDMWSVTMLLRHGPGAEAFGTSPDGPGAQLLRAVSVATVRISPHVIVRANDPAVPELRAAWAWAAKRHISLASTAGDVEYSRWTEIAAVSPYGGLFQGQLRLEFGSMTPDARIGGAFNQDEKVLITTSGLGAVVFFTDPRSLLGAAPEQVERLVPPGWTGPAELKTGMPGWRYFDTRGRSVKYEEGDPSGPDLGQPDSLLHRGPYYRITENGYTYRIAAPGNPALDDSNAVTISITAPDGIKTYLAERMPADDPGDGGGDGAPGDGGFTTGEGAEGGAADG